ncbi:MAG: NAD(P)H-hydrate epimerase [Planctomycetes bacterium]|nr:NAD(P)H-hydrate epimerase [Planctomycetota bacterium]
MSTIDDEPRTRAGVCSVTRHDRLSRDQLRTIDRLAVERLGIPSLVLMENAGRGCADLLERLGIDGPIVICCGKGNNGGDGFVIGRHLDLRGYDVRLLHWEDPREFSTDCRVNYEIAVRKGLAVERVSGDPAPSIGAERGAWCVDALLGTGSRGEPRPPVDRAIAWMNAGPWRRFAVDIPSGLDCDTGEPARHTVRAAHTAAMVAMKRGFAQPAAGPFLGSVTVVDIGVSARWIDGALDPPETGAYPADP